MLDLEFEVSDRQHGKRSTGFHSEARQRSIDRSFKLMHITHHS